jgi:protease-4
VKKRWVFLAAMAIVFILSIYSILVFWLIGKYSKFFVGSVALIRIEGVISASGVDGGLVPSAGVSPEEIIDQLRKADADNDVKSILFRVNSPGGTAAASQEIFREVGRTKKPVVVSIGDIGASGAYYIASAADRIVASPASEIGSIGVIVEAPNYQELFKKLGIDYVVITQGKYKDMGNPNRPLRPEERAILEEQIRIIYEQFVDDVAEGRKISHEKMLSLATGQTFTGTQALKLGLIDDLGNFRDAVDLAAKLGKIKGEPEIVEYGVLSLPDLIKSLFQSRSFGLKDLFLNNNIQVQPLPRQIPE